MLGLFDALLQVVAQQLWAIALNVGRNIMHHGEWQSVKVRLSIRRHLVFNPETRVALRAVALALQLARTHNDHMLDIWQIFFNCSQGAMAAFLKRRNSNDHAAALRLHF